MLMEGIATLLVVPFVKVRVASVGRLATQKRPVEGSLVRAVAMVAMVVLEPSLVLLEAVVLVATAATEAMVNVRQVAVMAQQALVAAVVVVPMGHQSAVRAVVA